ADRPDVWPMNNATSMVVNRMNPSHVEAVFIAGKVRKWRGRLGDGYPSRVMRLAPEAREGVMQPRGFHGEPVRGPRRCPSVDMQPASEASGFAANGGVRLHYVVAGAGPPLLSLHGIPDFCNGWRHQIEALHGRHRVAAMDLRGFNLSDKPADVRAYRIAE